MRFAISSLFALATVAIATSSDPKVPGNPVSPNPYPAENQSQLSKRGCLFGVLCFGTSTPDYTSDVNNCGRSNNRCSSLWSNGYGAQCSNGVCGPQYCYNLFDFNWLSGRCQDVSSDSDNW